MRTRRNLAVAAAAALCTGAILFAQTDQRPGQPGSQQPAIQTDPQGMKASERMHSEPRPEHRNLEPLVGTWNITGQCFEKSEASPEQASGMLTSEWILGNRFVKCKLNGMKGGKSIEGLGITGFDDHKNKYVSTWQDNQCNSIKIEEGTYDSGSKTFTLTGDGFNEDRIPLKCRKVIKIVSNDEHTMTAYLTESGKAERKVAELTFKRSGGARASMP